MNHEGYQRRLDLIQEVLKSYGLEVAYQPASPVPSVT